jgi:hypothetical protein
MDEAIIELSTPGTEVLSTLIVPCRGSGCCVRLIPIAVLPSADGC